ncbi:hypothetical protein GCM10009087_01440 [Sphingomonas oligophenolica]|uniref:Uncharacterized protein n=1 Tax=Sphingomonas oligophenolica TaxID=301154 RepID=A0ABU9Y117_9SPHN
MRRFSTLLIAATLLGTSAAAIAATPDNSKNEAKLAAALAGRVAGKPVNCISLSTIRSSQIIDHTAIIYESGSQLYVNRPRIGADSLDSDDILVSKTYGSELCSLDTINLVDRASHFSHGFVGLGEFVPYTKPAKH